MAIQFSRPRCTCVYCLQASRRTWRADAYIEHDCYAAKPVTEYEAEIVRESTEAIAKIMKFPSVF